MNLTVQIYKSVEPVGHKCGGPAPYLFLRHFLLFSDALPLVPLADPGDNPAMTPSGLSVGLVPHPAKNIAWTDGHLAIYSTYRANVNVGLQNLLSAGAFLEVKIKKKNEFVAPNLQHSPEI